MYELEDHNAEYESEIAQAKAERQALIDSDRPNWQNSLADLLEWQERHEVTDEEMTKNESHATAIATQLEKSGGNKWLNSNAYHFSTGMMMYIFLGDIWANIHFNSDMQITMINTGTSCNTGLSNEALKSFFTNE